MPSTSQVYKTLKIRHSMKLVLSKNVLSVHRRRSHARRGRLSSISPPMSGGSLIAKPEYEEKSGYDHHDIPALLPWDVEGRKSHGKDARDGRAHRPFVHRWICCIALARFLLLHIACLTSAILHLRSRLCVILLTYLTSAVMYSTDHHKHRRSRSTCSTVIGDDHSTYISRDHSVVADSHASSPKLSFDQQEDVNASKDAFHVLGPHIQSFGTRPYPDRDSSDTMTAEEPRKTEQASIGEGEESSSDEEQAKPGPPPAVGFWHPGLAHTRKEILRRYSGTLLVLCVAIMGILSIYWGVLFDVKRSLHKATVVVVSFEGTSPYQDYAPIVGPWVWAECEREMASHYDHLGFVLKTPADYNYDPNEVRMSVFKEETWAAIIINANATALLRQAVETGNSSYDPRGAALMIYNQARDIESYNFYIVPVLRRIMYEITTTFAANWAQQVFADTTLNSTIYSQSPQAVSPGIAFTTLNLRPFDPPTAIPTITIGLIYLIIIAFFSFTFFIPTHMKFILPNPLPPHPPLKFPQLIIYRWCATITAYFFLAMSYSLVSLAFQIPFSNSPPPAPNPLNVNGQWSPYEPVSNANYLGHATWFVYFLLNFVGMAALGLTCENMAMFLSALSPLPFSALFLIWWVITNVSTGFYAIELASGFYRWGYAWPLRHIVAGSKTLVFGTKSDLALNFGVLLAWVAVGTILFPMACWVMGWKGLKDRQRAAEAAKKAEAMK